MASEPKSYFKVAHEMYMLEHTRWNQHMLLFLGIIASLMTAAQAIKDIIPLEATVRVAAGITFLWLCAILSNRSSSHAWQNTLKTLENDPTSSKPFQTFSDERRKFGLLRDFASNFGIMVANGETKRRILIFSAVTRVYVALALLLMALFLSFPRLATYYKAHKPSNQLQQELGQRMIVQALEPEFPNAHIVEAFDLKRADGKRSIQLHITTNSGEHVMVSWLLSGRGATLERRGSPTP